MFKNNWEGHWLGNKPDGDLHNRAREVVRPTGTFMRGKIPSRKNGSMVDYEGLLERDSIFLFEASHHVVRYREQPTTIHYPDGARIRRYTPDFELVLDTGEILYIEIKHSNSLTHEKVRHKLSCIDRHFRASGINYLVLTEKVIRQEPRLSNLRKICAGMQRIWPTADAVRNALNQNSQQFPTTLQHANELLAKHHLNVFSLFVTGELSLDLTNPITPDTNVNITKENDNAYLWLA